MWGPPGTGYAACPSSATSTTSKAWGANQQQPFSTLSCCTALLLLNCFQNHWYASMRAKADCKTRTFLWVYGSMAGRNPDPSILEMAKERYVELAAVSGGALAPLASFMVPENYFTTGEGAQQYAILQQAELAAATLGPGHVPVRSASARAAMSQVRFTVLMSSTCYAARACWLLCLPKLWYAALEVGILLVASHTGHILRGCPCSIKSKWSQAHTHHTGECRHL
jgi:hypothetical protein